MGRDGLGEGKSTPSLASCVAVFLIAVQQVLDLSVLLKGLKPKAI